MDFTNTCCCCIPIRKGVFVVAVLTLLEGIGDIVLVLVLNLLQCYEGGHPDGWNNNDDDGHHADNYGYHTDNYSHLIDNYGYHNDNGDSYNLYDVSMVTPIIDVSTRSSCYYFQGVGIWIIALCINSFFYTVYLLIGVKKMIQQLMNRGLVTAAHPPPVVMPGIPVFHTAMPVGMYPPVMPVHASQPGRGFTTRLQPGIYAQPGTFAQPGTYAKHGTFAQPVAYTNPAFYAYAETYVHPQLGAYPQPGAYPLSGNSTQLGIHPGNGTSSPNDDQPPPYTLIQ